MRFIISRASTLSTRSTLALALMAVSLTGAALVRLGGASRAAAAEPRGAIDRQKTTLHLVEHQTYPATRAELLASCNKLADFSDAEKQWFATHLPEGTYPSADAVLKVLFRK